MYGVVELELTAGNGNGKVSFPIGIKMYWKEMLGYYMLVDP